MEPCADGAGFSDLDGHLPMVEGLLGEAHAVAPSERRRRAIDVIGQFSSGSPVGAERHDRYVADSIAKP